jgi:alkanesulfonate monooxygenase SsuD/methylene tetrahydromethanopterin reductase-like flavin-dependent oxidoreductase (luciferase family)
MRIGLCFDLRDPPAWRRGHASVYATALERAELADEIGIDTIWGSEHHGFEDGYLTQPLTFAAAVAARTSRVRVGTGVTIAPLRGTVDLVEQAAVVDLISNGRLELGLGAGYRRPEFDAYGVDISQRMPLLEQRAREVSELWSSGTLRPAPVQASAPLWLGVHGPRGARIAGRLGAGLLRLDAAMLEPYRAGLREGGHDEGGARLAGPANLVVSRDPERAWARIAPHLEYQWNSYAWYGAEGTDGPRGATPADGADAPIDAAGLRSPGPEMLSPNFDVVTPEEAVRRLRAWLGELPVVEAYFWESIAGMDDDLCREHIELLATEVRPALADI